VKPRPRERTEQCPGNAKGRPQAWSAVLMNRDQHEMQRRYQLVSNVQHHLLVLWTAQGGLLHLSITLPTPSTQMVTRQFACCSSCSVCHLVHVSSTCYFTPQAQMCWSKCQQQQRHGISLLHQGVFSSLCKPCRSCGIASRSAASHVRHNWGQLPRNDSDTQRGVEAGASCSKHVQAC